MLMNNFSYSSGQSIQSNEYDFVSNVCRAEEYQNVLGHTKVIDTYFDYDDRGRLLTVKQGVDNGS